MALASGGIGMNVRPHMSQHERIEELPLVTDVARVTRVTSLDHNRVDETEDAVPRILAAFDREEWIPTVLDDRENVDWDRLSHLVTTTDIDSELRTRIATLRDRITRPYPSLVSVQVETPVDFSFVAGQYVSITYDGTPRPYSISCSPTADHVEICVRRVPDGRLSSRLCAELEQDDRVTLRGPYGDFVLGPPSARDLVFLATGTGVAPLRSMIEYVFETNRSVVNGDPRDVWLFLGAGWKDDLPYHHRFRELDRATETFHYVPCLTREPILTDWNGETDYVQHTLLKYVDPTAIATADLPDRFGRVADAGRAASHDPTLHPDEMEVYACGINAMVHAAIQAVDALGVDPGNVFSEGYG